MNTKFKPSLEQKEILEHVGNTIVISNPGTGKTYTLALKVLELLEQGVKPETILCVTFTDKARKEMFEYIYKMKSSKFSDSEIMKINIHTFHSFAYNYLVESGFTTGEIVVNNVMRYAMLQSLLQNSAFTYSKEYIISEIIPKVENAARYIKSFGITPNKINIEKASKIIEQIPDEYLKSFSHDELKAFLKYFVDAYGAYELSKGQAIDYTDMLILFIEKFNGKKFEHVLVDEMQDMNDLEAQIAQMVGKTLFLVGDSKQAIFGFQGGSTKNFTKFLKICEPKFLSLNQRSTQQILDFSKTHFLGNTKNKQMFERELTSLNSHTTGPIPKIISTSSYLSKILEIIQQYPKQSIGIITRKNGQIIEISRYLDSNNIKYSSTSSQATTAHAKQEILTFVKGLFSQKLEDKISATFTVFSPYTIQEAFEFSMTFKRKEFAKLSNIKSWGMQMRLDDLDILFAKTILPLCVAKGAEWFSTALAVKQQIIEYLSMKTPTLEGLLDYIAITEESYTERNNDSQITLTTVHKAKGLAFDVVVYLPSSAVRTSFVDRVVESILEASGIDVRDEVEEESLRIDFVAFTRARTDLIIITDSKNSRHYHLEDYSEIQIDERQEDLIATRLDGKLSEAYSLFLAGRVQDSQKLLQYEDGWLKAHVVNYFNNLDTLSYSRIKTEPYEFLIKNIINIPRSAIAADFGTEVHDAIKAVNTGQAKIDDYDGDIRSALENVANATGQLQKVFPGLTLVGAEKHYAVPLGSMIQYEGEIITFNGFIDAIYKHNKGYLIVDYKTDKNTSYASDHKRQLAVYRKMHSVLENIPEDKISVCIIFVALRGSISTGRFDWEIEYEKKNAFATFEKHLRQVLEWKDHPQKFIDQIISDTKTDPLFLAIKEKLVNF